MVDRPQFASELLQFKPRWWWDPIPPWFLQELDRGMIVELVRVQLDMQETVLKQQVKAIAATRQILQQMK